MATKKTTTNPTLIIKRYPATSNRSLQAWSAADELALETLADHERKGRTIALYEDRFGYLTAHLHDFAPFTIISYKSQQKAIEKNLARNGLPVDQSRWLSPLAPLPGPIDLAVLKIPKSLDLFRLHLAMLGPHLHDESVVICPFMTRYFSPQMLAIAEAFFESVEQSLARKKARLLMMRKNKPSRGEELLHPIPMTFDDGMTEELQQYFGVFSADHIDYATQFLLEHLDLASTDHKILDLAAGNGVIARAIQRNKPDAELHLVDDFLLAIESSKLNLAPEHTYFHWDDTLASFPKRSFDLVVSNPPFHFGHETNIEVTLRLFHETAAVLRPGGRFVCVANRHLNYKTHLQKHFPSVKILAQNDKYIIYSCLKARG